MHFTVYVRHNVELALLHGFGLESFMYYKPKVRFLQNLRLTDSCSRKGTMTTCVLNIFMCAEKLKNVLNISIYVLTISMLMLL